MDETKQQRKNICHHFYSRTRTTICNKLQRPAFFISILYIVINCHHNFRKLSVFYLKITLPKNAFVNYLFKKHINLMIIQVDKRLIKLSK